MSTTVPAIGRKQRTTEAEWARAWTAIQAGAFDPVALERKFAHAVEDVALQARGRVTAFGWSGGKDSLALELVMRAAGVRQCCMVLTHLEYPAFLQWATDVMPPELEIVQTGLDLDWLCANPAMLFPMTAALAGRWFRLNQHTGQARYVKAHGIERLFLGRRRADGNVITPLGYMNRWGIAPSSPLADWAHTDVLALLAAREIRLPPIYSWPRGYQVGTGPWPARQWCGTVSQGWREVFTIDPAIVRGAARRIPSAAVFLEGAG